jgi:hypothetical protein
MVSSCTFKVETTKINNSLLITKETIASFSTMTMKDLFGKAILDYQTNNAPEDLITETSISEEDAMSVAYLFRNFEEMPKLEQEPYNSLKEKFLMWVVVQEVIVYIYKMY